jgi:hypothetical protein
MRVGGTLLLVELLLASAAPAAPPGAQSVLNAAARATGRFDASSTIEMRGSIDAEGRTGDYREAVRMRDGAFVSHAQYSLFGEGDGYDGRTRWKQDRSAASHALDAPFSKADAMTLAWLKRRAYLQPGSARIERVKHEAIGGRAATILTMRPRGGNSIDLAFDNSTHLLVQARRTRPLSIVTETYRDYRPVGSAKVPFNIAIEDSGDIQTIHPGRYERVKATTPFSAPPQPRDLLMTGPAKLPLASLSFAVVPATINGHQYDFILDTGGHNIVTPEIAAALNLTSAGKGTSGGSGPGRAEVSDTQIAELKLGSATMTNQHFTVLDLDGAVKRKGKPDMAGILGLEIFERMAVTVDEPANTLTIEPFEPGRPCEGDKIPLLFDDDQPSVQGTIDGVPALIGIDVGNGGPAIALWRWAEAHKVADRFRAGKEGSGSGVGGSNVTYLTKHHDIVVGRTMLRDMDVNYATTKTGYFSSRADSMNLGRALLQKYAVRFDYAQGHMCVIKPKA